MTQSNFIDYVKICGRSGKGGAGSTHFRKEKFVPKGGPDGGDGGRGGDIILRGNRNIWTLLHLKYRKHVIAGNGQPGAGARKSGASGEDVILDVPLGTVVKDAETGRIEFEITKDKEERVLVPGGRGGLGNTHFKSSTNQAPQYSQPGEPGLEEWKILELKLLADVGLVGFPNAGKSTFLASVSAAKPKIADYAFTTLKPNLGVVEYRDEQSFVVADIPGIIEGAAEGRGLGHQFLRHIERNGVLLFLVSAESDHIQKQYEILLDELRRYNPEMLTKPRVLAITKSDLLDDELQQLISKEIEVPHIFISSITGKNIQELKDLLWKEMNERVYDKWDEEE